MQYKTSLKTDRERSSEMQERGISIGTGVGIIVVCAIVAVAMFTGCIEKETPTPTITVVTPTPTSPLETVSDKEAIEKAETKMVPVNDSLDTSIEYGDPTNWVSLPTIDKAVDVFYVYPTVSDNQTGAMDITNSPERDLAIGIFKSQASVFESHANVFAPYYRQMSTNVQMPDDPSALATDTKEFKQGAVDVQDAFDYYIENLNNNRPFIIAGHSQGTMALIELIKSRFGNNTELRDRLVAAYLIGYTVTDSDLSTARLTAAQSENDFGVVITYNTQSITSEGGPMLLPGAHCINPLNWKTDSTYAPDSQNKGAVFFDDATGEFIREVPNYCSAQINMETGALTTSIVDTLEIGPYTEGVYHRYDYAFWYRNLEENIGIRINAFLQNK